MRRFHKTLYSAGHLKSITNSLVLIYEDFKLNDEFINEIIPAIKEQNNQLSKLLVESKNTDINKALSETDRRRDASFTALREYCKIFESYFIPYKARAAREIAALIREIGWNMNIEGYNEENIKIDKLINHLNSPKYQDDIATIGAESLVDELVKTQKEFETLYKKEVLEVDSSEYPGIRKVKQELGDLLITLVSYTMIKANFHENMYGDLRCKVTEIIDESTEAIKANKTTVKV